LVEVGQGFIAEGLSFFQYSMNVMRSPRFVARCSPARTIDGVVKGQHGREGQGFR
jgi:hypothetical protein